MSIAHILDDFGTPDAETTISISDVTLEEERLAAFESGYKAGWDDATKAQQEDRKRISADFAANLHDLSFTYREAQSGLLAELEPLLTGMVETVLPRLAHASLGLRVVEMLQDMARAASDAPVQIVTAPSNAEVMEELIEKHVEFPVTVRREETLGEGQVHISFGGSETRIDLQAVLAEIDSAVTGFFESCPTGGPRTQDRKESA
ncbi:MAG: flagellar biosynthesis protein [Roseovarius sp.]|nr:flagellar biosynthesis protein [Roseovarius sp.]